MHQQHWEEGELQILDSIKKSQIPNSSWTLTLMEDELTSGCHLPRVAWCCRCAQVPASFPDEPLMCISSAQPGREHRGGAPRWPCARLGRTHCRREGPPRSMARTVLGFTKSALTGSRAAAVAHEDAHVASGSEAPTAREAPLAGGIGQPKASARCMRSSGGRSSQAQAGAHERWPGPPAPPPRGPWDARPAREAATGALRAHQGVCGGTHSTTPWDGDGAGRVQRRPAAELWRLQLPAQARAGIRRRQFVLAAGERRREWEALGFSGPASTLLCGTI